MTKQFQNSNIKIHDLGLIDYEEALKIQHEFVLKRMRQEIPDSLLIMEHPSVFTLGRRGLKENLLVRQNDLAKDGIRLLEVDRGGDITFHSPGQLVGYPIIDLKPGKKDLHNYMRVLESVIIKFLGAFGIEARRIAGKTGVWVKNSKIAFIGIAAKNWVTYHGFSININNDIAPFKMINPCGMKDIKITWIRNILGINIEIDKAKRMLLNEFCSAMA